jgi:SAM-dependent methyltransferase
MAALQERLFHEVTPLTNLPIRKDLEGVGMSDEELYSRILEEKFTYLNTFFHTEPRLDIASPPERFLSRFHFVVCADVMEHVRPPIDTAFRNLRSLLKPGGLLVLSVPFGLEGDTVEHFPDLNDYKILGKGKDRYLVNVSEDGQTKVFHNLVFHGGKGETLEMRLFSRAGLLRLLETSGFHDIQIHSQSMPQWGIVNRSLFSLPITAIAG